MSGILLSIALSFVSAPESQELTLLSQFNPYPSVGYNDCWGYTDNAGNQYGLLGVQNGTSIVDLRDPRNPREVNFIPSNRSLWKDIKTYKHYAYVVNESGGGLQIIDLSGLPERADLVATYTGFQTSHNINIDVDRGILYAEGTHGRPVRTLSLANPLAPVEISSFGVECHDVYAKGTDVYVSEGGHGSIGIFDLSDPANPRLKARFQIPNSGYVHNAWTTDDGNFLMTTEETNPKTVKLWDIRDLNNVRKVSEYLAPNRLAHNVHIQGDYAYISHYGSGLRVIDIKNKDSISEVGYREAGPMGPGFVGVWGTYPHFNSDIVLASDMEDGLLVVEHKR